MSSKTSKRVEANRTPKEKKPQIKIKTGPRTSDKKEEFDVTPPIRRSKDPKLTLRHNTKKTNVGSFSVGDWQNHKNHGWAKND